MPEHTFNPVSIIRKKRDNKPLSREEIARMIERYTRDELPDYQMSAFLMAVYLNGFNEEEAGALTRSMLESGKTLDLDGIPGRKVDKHSTGGVGDKLSLILAPIVASYGIPVPMISGRGLGHTGGTLDKLESIPGFNVNISLDLVREILAKHNLVMAGQTEEIAPADKRLYALRDVTGTVESIPLIAGSIMSKKLAEGIDALVLDVKYGTGAFMGELDDAIELAETLVAIGEEFSTDTVAYLTDMNQPLGCAVGNWLEVKEAAEALRGEGPEDVMEVTHQLAGTMICLGGRADSVEEGMEKSIRAVDDGRAYEQWLSLVTEQGGDAEYLEHPDRYEEAGYRFEFKAEKEGYIQSLDAFNIGMASLECGAGRKTKEDDVDPAAGVMLKKKIGDFVEKNETIATGYTNNNHAIGEVRKYLSRAYAIGETAPDSPVLIVRKVDKKGVHLFKS